MRMLLRVLRFFRPDTARLVFTLGLLILSTATSLLKPWPLALMVDSVLGNKPLPAWMHWAAGWDRAVLLSCLAFAILLVQAGHGTLSAWQNYSSIQIGLRGLVRVRREIFQWLEQLSLRWSQGRTQGDLIYRASWDTYAVQTLFQQGLFTLLTSSLSLLLMWAVMWRLNAALTLWSVLMVPMLVLAMQGFGRVMKQRSLAAHQADSQVTSFLQQTIAALPLIQSYTQEEVEQDRFAAKVDEAYDQRVKQHGWEVIYWLVIALGFGLAAAGVTWLGAKAVLTGKLTTGELLVFVGYLTQLYEPLSQLSHVGATVSDASASAQRVLELLDTPQEITDGPDARAVVSEQAALGGALSETGRRNIGLPSSTSLSRPEPLKVRGQISFDHVCFGYQPERLVLKDISFSVAAGDAIAILGPSGAGKTTLIQLLPRFYDPAEGAVGLDGVDLRELQVKGLRAQVAYVPQEPILLLASLAENIAYGKPGATAAEIEAAARAAHADEFIRALPQGYDTLVGEGAARLSVGEKQRVNLARAFLKNAPILVLDEPTSALDVESEEMVVESLGELMHNRTALIVAHRLSTIRRVDRIVVLDAGQLVETGTPEELLTQNGYYARVAGGQLRWQ